MKEILKITQASFSYGKKLIFDDVNLAIHPSEVLCLLGPNGTGKSTLIECLMGINPLKKGSVFVNGVNIKALKPQDIAKTIAYVPQLHHVTFPFEVIEIVLMGRAKDTKFYSSPKKEDEEIAENALALVGMENFKHRLFFQLSGGEKQLVMIARALAQETPVIILDEPTAHLDMHHEQQVLDTILHLVKKLKVSFLMATHAPNHAFFFSNENVQTKVAFLHNKNIRFYGEPEEVLHEENIKQVFNVHTKIITHMEQDKSYNFILPLSREREY